MNEKVFLLQIAKGLIINIGILQEDGNYADDCGGVQDTFEPNIYEYKYLTHAEFRMMINEK